MSNTRTYSRKTYRRLQSGADHRRSNKRNRLKYLPWEDEDMKWNDIPFDENAEPEVKALEFDLQVAENAQAASEPKPLTGQTSYDD